MSKKKKKEKIPNTHETAYYVKKDLKLTAILSAIIVGIEILLYLVYG